MTEKDIIGKSYCNCLAQVRGLDPVGYARSFDDAIVIEVPLPWKRDMMAQANPLPQEFIDLLQLWREHYQATGEYRHSPLAIAPDTNYTLQGYRRVMFFTRPDGLFAQLEKVEYLVPVDELGALVWALYQEQDKLPQFEPYLVPDADSIRDILVCTHGTVDAACAKFGYPLYKHMRDTYANDALRVWRVSHFGGHVFAPTLMDMPTVHYWAYVENEQAEQIVRRSGNVAALRGYYRGWTGADAGFQQVAECDLWQQHGWAWFDYHKKCETVAQDDSNESPQWADVRCQYIHTDHTTVKEADYRVTISHTIETIPSTNANRIYNYPQYRVVESEIYEKLETINHD